MWEKLTSNFRCKNLPIVNVLIQDSTHQECACQAHIVNTLLVRVTEVTVSVVWSR